MKSLKNKNTGRNRTKLKEYIADAGKLGVKVLPPDINLSQSDFAVTDGSIRFGLLAIKNVGRNFTEAIVRERQKGKFKSFDEFVSRLVDCDTVMLSESLERLYIRQDIDENKMMDILKKFK